jgi:hypothetical protein
LKVCAGEIMGAILVAGAANGFWRAGACCDLLLLRRASVRPLRETVDQSEGYDGPGEKRAGEQHLAR